MPRPARGEGEEDLEEGVETDIVLLEMGRDIAEFRHEPSGRDGRQMKRI